MPETLSQIPRNIHVSLVCSLVHTNDNVVKGGGEGVRGGVAMIELGGDGESDPYVVSC
jgi:hypothetical protein